MPFQVTGTELLDHGVEVIFRTDGDKTYYAVEGAGSETRILAPNGTILHGGVAAERLALLWEHAGGTTGQYDPIGVCELAAARPEMFTREQLIKIDKSLVSARVRIGSLLLRINRALYPAGRSSL